MAKHAGGRPPIEIRWEDFDKLCALHCTQLELASWFKCSVDTIARAVQKKWRISFAEYYEEKAAAGRISLRRKQYELAMSGNITMLIWLGKQWLDQREQSKMELIGSLGGQFGIIKERIGGKIVGQEILTAKTTPE